MNEVTRTLLIDAGNTRIKFGLASSDSNGLQVVGACDSQSSTQAITAWLIEHGVQVDRAIGVCVASNSARGNIEAALLGIHPSAQVQWLTGASPLKDLRNNYATPTTLGPDRWLAAYGAIHARQLSKQALIIASFGTATTVDCVHWDDSQRCHVFDGGIIIAGLSTAWRSVSLSTAQLPDVSRERTVEGHSLAIPNSTTTALQLGAMYAQAGAVQQLVNIAAQRYSKVALLVSGGAAHHVIPYLKDVVPIEFPVLLGLTMHTTQA